ncbi:MAG TPA: hypothetical protein VNH18_14955 [Bryobacteraceae bacterium]|nr:hypothetical protein [Bryobacteraceae bacterium]
MRRAGVPDPPPIPEFDAVFRRLPAEVRQKLYAALRENAATTPVEAIRLWQPLIRSAFGAVKQ